MLLQCHTVLWQVEGERDEVETGGEKTVHQLENLGERSFVADGTHSRQLVVDG